MKNEKSNFLLVFLRRELDCKILNSEAHNQLVTVLSNLDPEFELVYVDDGSQDKTAEILRELQYDNAMKWLSRAACLFRPSLPQETFGLVYLEANFLGVPVLTNSIDSAKEVIKDKNNMFMEKDTTIEDVLEWQVDIENKFTKVDLDKFGVDVIAKKWMSLIE